MGNTRDREVIVTDREACRDLCRFVADMLHWCDQHGCHDTGTVSVSTDTLFRLFMCARDVHGSIVHGCAVRVPKGHASMYDYLRHGRSKVDLAEAARWGRLEFGPAGREKTRRESRKSGEELGLTRNEWPI